MLLLRKFPFIVLLSMGCLLIFTVRAQDNPPPLDATLQDTLLVDKDGDGRLDAGETLRYILEVTNCGTAAAENVQVTGQYDPNTRPVANEISISQSAFNCPQQGITPVPVPTSSVPAGDSAPVVQSSTPANNATEVILHTTIALQFSESVTVTGNWFEMVCSLSGTFSLSAANITVTGGPINFTLDPTIDLQGAETCTVTVFAASVTDTDTQDPPDSMAADHVFSFTTDIDAAPTVQSITPANGAASVAANTTIQLVFSEPVNIPSAAAFSVECPAGLPIGFTVTTPATLPASASTVVITPASPLPAATTCTVTVFAAQVTDSDGDDPPNNMAADFVATFATEAPPSVTTTTPANGATGIATGSNIVVNFDEPVDVSTSSFTIECPAAGTSYTYTLAGSGTNSITLDPTTNLLANQTCTVTVVAAQVNDSDLIDPPQNMTANFVFSFDTVADTAPVASSPLDGATGVATNSNIVINFNEAVDVTAGAFAVECPVGTPVTFTSVPALPTTNQTSITLDPTTSLPATSTCSVTVLAANITDTDTDEPPNNMAADYSFTFDTLVDLAPTVNQPAIAPASTSTGANAASLNNPVSTTPTLTIPFSESVNVASGAFTLTCNAVPVTVSTSPALPALGQTSIDVSPVTAVAQGANCVLTVVAANISDADSDDPPNGMVTNFALSFVVDTAPAATLTETEVGGTFQNVTGAGASSVDLDSDLRVTFNEAVTVTFPATGLQCPAGNNIPVTVTTNSAATIVLNPNANLPLNTTCVLNIPAANLSDVDTADAPDAPLAAVSHSFQTSDDDAPTVTTNPVSGGGNVAVSSNITVTFNEPVTLTGAWFDLTCSVSGNRVSTGELTGTGITIIENTSDLVYTLDPTLDLAAGDICTITIDSANVVDNDLIDSPNELDGDASADVTDGDADDYVAIFSTTDLPPQVLNTTPAAASTVGAGQVVTINFTEAVNVTAGAFTFECPSGTPLSSGFTSSVALPATGITTLDLTPTDPLPFGAACTVTINSSLVVDQDPVDPPNFLDGDASGDLLDDADNFILNFQVDAQPTLLSSEVEIAGVLSPASGAVNVDIDTNIVLTFSEAVNAGSSSFSLECPAGTVIPFTVLGTGTNTITVDPTPAFLTVNTLCDFDMIAANITDVDTADAPNTLAADVNFTFRTVNDNFPAVSTAEVETGNVFTALPLGAGTFADADTDLRITFSEAVNLTGNWAELNCTSSGIQDVILGLVVTNADPVFRLNPATSLSAGENCTLTIFASQVADDDGVDPPNNMAANAFFTFVVRDTPPQVDASTSSPANGDTVPNNQVVTFNFTEIVDIAAGAISFVCNAVPVPFTPALPQNNVTSITLTPSAALTNGASCTVTLESTLITDDDTADAPDQLDGNSNNDVVDGDVDDFVLTFTVDSPPTVTTTIPANGATGISSGSNIVVDFDESVNVNTSSFIIEYPAGGTSYSYTLTGSGTNSITLDPTTNLLANTVCVVTVVATQTTDADGLDSPNQLDGNGDGVEGDNLSFSFTISATANADAYTITPQLTYASSAASLNVGDNDQPTTATITGFGPALASANGTVPNGTNFITAGGVGGRVVLNADGTFTFYPDAGDTAASRTATFFYTVAGGATAQVTLTFDAQEAVWFVYSTPDGSSVCTTTNEGTQACPAALATVAALDTSSDTIFVASGSYTCDITRTTNERLIGDGSSSTLQARSGVNPVAGSSFAPYAAFSSTDPVLTSSAADCVTLATGNTINGLTIGDTGNFAGIVGSNYGTATIAETTISGTGQILNLDMGTVNAIFDSLSSTISDNSFATLRVANSTVHVTSTGGTTITGTQAGVESILLIQNSGTGFNLGTTSVLTGHSTGEFNLVQSAGIFGFFNGGNAGATINQTGTITPAGACATPTLSGLVYENRSRESIVRIPPAAEVTTLVADVLTETLSLGAQTVHAQSSTFNLPLGPLNLGTIPPGTKVTIVLDVDVNAIIPPGTSEVTLQGLLSGSNFSSFLTDDPETAAESDVTRTALDSLQAVGTLPQTGEEPWWRSVLVWALRLGVLAIVISGVLVIRRRFLSRV